MVSYFFFCDVVGGGVPCFCPATVVVAAGDVIVGVVAASATIGVDVGFTFAVLVGVWLAPLE